MRLLRTIFIHHKHHLRNPKCTLSSFLSHFSTKPSETSDYETHHRENQSTSWSSYGDVFDTPVAKNTFGDHSDDKVENFPQEKPCGRDVFATPVAKNTLSDQRDDEVENFPQGKSSGRDVFATPVAKDTLSDHSDDEVENFPQEKPSGRVSNSTGATNVIFSTSKRKGKAKTQWVCCNCGHTVGKWWGSCPSCSLAGTMKEFHEAKDSVNRGNELAISEEVVGSWLPQRSAELRPMRLDEVNRGFNQENWRIYLPGHFGNEVSTVLGGGLVPGSLTLIGGDPGIGKSTLLLQVAALIAEVCKDSEASSVVYVSGEESLEQIGSRADRLGIKSNIFLYSSTDVEDILKKAQCHSPCALIVDSIQTVYLKDLLGSVGGINQVKECTSALMRFAKSTNIPVLLIGHVTKTGDLAGPRVLEHIVDVVLYMEGERQASHRMLRAVKNRFGSTDELGVFEMSQSGLEAVSDASEIFLTEHHSNSNVLAGLAITVIMDGSRSFLIEIQALCFPNSSVTSGQVNGIPTNRANMIICVLIKQAGLHLEKMAVLLNVVSGLKLEDTAGDLAIAAAICSSFLEFPIPKGVAFMGEIGLCGEVRMVPRIEKRVYTLAKLGYRICVVPKLAKKALETKYLENMKIVGCNSLTEVIEAVFKRDI